MEVISKGTARYGDVIPLGDTYLLIPRDPWDGKHALPVPIDTPPEVVEQLKQEARLSLTKSPRVKTRNDGTEQPNGPTWATSKLFRHFAGTTAWIMAE